MAALFRIIGRYPLMAFMVIGLGAGFLSPAVRPIAGAEVLPFGLPLHGVLERLLGVGFGAFVLTGADAGREAVVDLAQCSVGYFTRDLRLESARPARGWVAEGAGGRGRSLRAPARAFRLAEEIGFTGFLQHHWPDRYHPMKLTLYVALL